MKRILSMAVKDLKILLRDKTGAFFVIGFPILMGLFFGLMMGGAGSNSSTSKMKVSAVDLDQSEMSQKFVDLLASNTAIELLPGELEASKDNVRKGRHVGVIVLQKGFGDNVGVFWGQPPEIQLGMDPSRGAESGMLQGYIMQAVGEMAGQRFNNPDQFRPALTQAKDDAKNDPSLNPINRQLLLGFLGTVDSMIDAADTMQTKGVVEGENEAAQTNFEFAKISNLDITRQLDPKSQAGQVAKIRSQWDISFPQAMLWGILGCIAGFAASIARENAHGTLMRLQVAPLSRFEVLAGKAMACFFAVLFVITMMTGLGYFLGMRPGNILHLVLAAVSVAVCFVGIMMTLSVVGKTEQAVAGIGWMSNMVMAMIGGCMIPVMFMPEIIKRVSILSPVKWAIAAIEGAIWRDFTLVEMLLPCGILLGVGTVGMVVGSILLSKRLS
jgi:ABC-2 type transport system permease protein